MLLNIALAIFTTIYFLFVLSLLTGLFSLKSLRTNDSQPFVTVIVPARNEEKTISRLLDSLLLQSYPKTKYEVNQKSPFLTMCRRIS